MATVRWYEQGGIQINQPDTLAFHNSSNLPCYVSIPNVPELFCVRLQGSISVMLLPVDASPDGRQLEHHEEKK